MVWNAHGIIQTVELQGITGVNDSDFRSAVVGDLVTVAVKPKGRGVAE